MPRAWHDRHAAGKIVDEDERELYRRIVADKKPYFMRYIYPALMKQYNTYIKNTDRNALREFQLTVNELRSMPFKDLTERQVEFLRYYDMKMPVGVNDCVMNKICRIFEDAFDGYVGKSAAQCKFSYEIMRNDSAYTASQYNAIKRLYENYNKRLANYAVFVDSERVDEYDSFATLSVINEEFERECSEACPDRKAMCNIVLDLCYTRNSTRRFAWNMCGTEIVEALLEKNDNMISIPVMDDTGDIEYCGNRFRVERRRIEVIE